MICRDSLKPNGIPCLILIPQVESARMAGTLARHWNVHGTFISKRLTGGDETIAAITHHADGWIESDSHLQLDSKTSRPLDFTETSLDCWLAVCEHSINACAKFGPLAGLLATSYFHKHIQFLFDRRWPSNDAQESIKSKMDTRFDGYFRDWSSQNPSMNTRTRVHDASYESDLFVQLAFVLLCYEPKNWFEQFRHRPRVRLTDLITGNCRCEEPNVIWVTDPIHNRGLSIHAECSERFRIDPWPLDVPELRLSVTAKIIPNRLNSNQVAIKDELGPDITLTFHLIPATST